MFNSRQDDLSKVFDKTWRANHNNDVKIFKEKEKKFMNKMFSNDSNHNVVKPLTPGERAENLQNNINSAFNGHKQNNLNNIIKKWK